MRVVIAPDSFKGSLPAPAVAKALADGWREVRPGDEVREVPLADGGEGASEVVRRAHPDAVEMPLTVTGPDGRPVAAGWTLLPDGTAVVELARASGLPLMAVPAPLTAHTIGLGELLRAAAGHPATRRLVVALGGSASTDAGAGALQALGVRYLDGRGDLVHAAGGGMLTEVATIDRAALVPPPSGGVVALVDVDAPLLGSRGAATQFGPQKGATNADVDALDRALSHFAATCRDAVGDVADASAEGSGAAGGAAFGLCALWGATMQPGAPTLAALAGLGRALEQADLVVTGEGRFDEQSLRGKVVGHVIGDAVRRGTTVRLAVGEAAAALPAEVADCVDLVSLAGSADLAMAHAATWLHEAGRRLAQRQINEQGEP